MRSSAEEPSEMMTRVITKERPPSVKPHIAAFQSYATVGTKLLPIISMYANMCGKHISSLVEVQILLVNGSARD